MRNSSGIHLSGHSAGRGAAHLRAVLSQLSRCGRGGERGVLHITIISGGTRMKKRSRREAMRTIGAAGAGVTLAGMTEAAAQIPAAPAFRGQHQIKPLPFDPVKVNGISEKMIRSHHENNYSGAVRALNAVEQRLDAMMKDKDLPAHFYGDLKREEMVRTSSVTARGK